MKKALILAGGWDGHHPMEVAKRFQTALQDLGIETSVMKELEILATPAELEQYDVIIPCWTMGTLSKEQSNGLQEAVRSGCGLAGIHGGMGDAFRGDLDYEWMVGGHFVGHPHVGEYTVCVKDFSSPIMRDVPSNFLYKSEQYYMLMDPAVHVLADSQYTYEDRSCTMPVVWIRWWGKGRVFYSALGHDPAEFDEFPFTFSMALRGICWAAKRI